MTTRANILAIAAILVLAVMTVLLLDRYGRNSRVYKVAGLVDQPQVAKHLLATPGDAYLTWKKVGLKGRTVVYVVDAWERLDLANSGEMPMSRPYPLKLYRIAEAEEAKGITSSRLLYVASLNGIVRSIMAVLSQDGFSQILQSARKSRDAQIDSREIYYAHQGFPRRFTVLQQFGGVQEPVLLHVSASFFRTATPDDLYRKLKESGLLSDCITLCREEGDSRVTEEERSRLDRFAQLIGAAHSGQSEPGHP